MAHIGSQAHRCQLPPQPLALDIAYRRAAGLSTAEKTSAGNVVLERLVPYQDVGVVLGKGQTRRDAWLVNAARLGLNAISERWVSGAMTTRNYHHSLQNFRVIRTRAFGGSDSYGPRQLWQAQRGAVQAPMWSEHMQFIALHMVNEALGRLDYASAVQLLETYRSDLSQHGHYHLNSQFSHFNGTADLLLVSALRVLKIRAGHSDCGVLQPDAGSGSTFTSRGIPYHEPIDAYALYLAPYGSLAAMKETPLLQILQEDLGLAQSFGDSVRRFCSGTHPLPKRLNLAQHRNLAPCLTADSSPIMQGIEREVDLACYALRESDRQPQTCSAIASRLYHLLSHDDVYPHLGFFEGTRVAMGMLADAQTWTDGPPPFTSAIAGFGALLRRMAYEGGDPQSLEQPDVIFERFLDPFHVALEHDAMIRHAHAYISAAAAAGHFTEATARNMQHSVVISRPDHRAAAIVVHSDGEGA